MHSGCGVGISTAPVIANENRHRSHRLASITFWDRTWISTTPEADNGYIPTVCLTGVSILPSGREMNSKSLDRIRRSPEVILILSKRTSFWGTSNLEVRRNPGIPKLLDYELSIWCSLDNCGGVQWICLIVLCGEATSDKLTLTHMTVS